MTVLLLLFAPLWNALGPPTDAAPTHLHWELRVTPPFPEQPGTWVSYAYGSATEPTLHDAERISPPFAKVIHRPGTSPEVISLRTSLSVAETQRFPARDAFDPESMMRGSHRSDLEPAWCAWVSTHGAIVSQLHDAHHAFIDALHCR